MTFLSLFLLVKVKMSIYPAPAQSAMHHITTTLPHRLAAIILCISVFRLKGYSCLCCEHIFWAYKLFCFLFVKWACPSLNLSEFISGTWTLVYMLYCLQYFSEHHAWYQKWLKVPCWYPYCMPILLAILNCH